MKIEWNKVTWYSKLAAVLFIVLLSLGSFYLGKSYQKEVSQIQYQNELNRIYNEQLNQKINSSEKISQKAVNEEKYLRLISPNGGETLCLNDNFPVRWESKGIQGVNLTIEGDGIFYLIKSLPASFNETGEGGSGLFMWKVGETSIKLTALGREKGEILKEGFGYIMGINSMEDPQIIDRSDKPFSIQLCKG